MSLNGEISPKVARLGNPYAKPKLFIMKTDYGVK